MGQTLVKVSKVVEVKKAILPFGIEESIGKDGTNVAIAGAHWCRKSNLVGWIEREAVPLQQQGKLNLLVDDPKGDLIGYLSNVPKEMLDTFRAMAAWRVLYPKDDMWPETQAQWFVEALRTAGEAKEKTFRLTRQVSHAVIAVLEHRGTLLDVVDVLMGRRYASKSAREEKYWTYFDARSKSFKDQLVESGLNWLDMFIQEPLIQKLCTHPYP
jgi:hypothetical protein